ncbi:MAG: hypothetical protein JWP12_1215 [Bacteroidetes bacterium]|nr:hypothetical protein [Bacteroidota bacterium]
MKISMPKKPIFILAVLFLSMAVSCTKEDNTEFTDAAIIEAYLNDGHYFSLSVSRQIPFSDNVTYSSDDINNLSIAINYNGSTHTLTPLGNGQYSDSTIVINQGNVYNLSFTFNNQNVTATTSIPAKPINFQQSVTGITVPPQVESHSGPTGTLPDPVELSWNNPDGSNYFVVIQNMETNPVPITTGATGQSDKTFRTPPTNLTVTEIRPLDFQYYGMHRLILYHVLPDYAALYATGNNSSQNLANPSTAITNGYGIFTGLNSDTLFIDVIHP